MQIYKIGIINPLLLLSLSWLAVLIVYLTYPINIIYHSGLYGIFTLISLIILSLTVSLISGFKKIIILRESDLRRYNNKKSLIITLLILTLLEILLKGAPPIFTGADYTTWGISGLHGFINILGLYVSASSLILYILYQHSKFKNLLIVLLIFIWQVMVLNRAILMLNLLSIVFILFCLRKIKFFHLVIISFFMIFLMGLVGDLRGMAGDYIYEITDPKPWARDFGIGFVWVVTYFTTAFSNLLFNIEIIDFIKFEPLYLINEFLPNLIKININNGNEIFLYDGNFNATSVIRPSLLAFGFIGPQITFILIILLNTFFFTRARNFPWFVFMSFYSAASILSCYENTIFTPWVIFIYLLSTNFKLMK